VLGFIDQPINYPLSKIYNYKDIIASPDKDDPLKCRQDNYMESKYLTIKQTGDNFYDATNQNIIAISETKLNDTTSANLHIPGYLFIHTDSKS